MRSTKIVATIGPASREPDVLERIVAAGMDVARLNFAHGTPEEHAETCGRIREAAEKVGRVVAILGDLPGPKLRLGPVAGGVTELARGADLALTQDQTEGTSERLPVAWKGLGELVDEGDICYLADGAVRLRVKGVTDGDVNTEVEVGGASPPGRASTCPTSPSRCRRSPRTTWRWSMRASTWASTCWPCPSCAAVRTSSRCGSTCARAAASCP